MCSQGGGTILTGYMRIVDDIPILDEIELAY